MARRIFTRKRLLWLAVPVVLLLLLYMLRAPIMRGMANFLISEDEPETCEVLFVLGGNSKDRGQEAARLYQEGFIKKVVCIGENVPTIFEAMGMNDLMESEVTKVAVLRNGVDSAAVELLPKGTSTREEAQEIALYCKEQGIEKAMIVSTRLHTRRVRKVFEQAFEGQSTKLVVVSVSSSQYEEELWWQSEEGMIALNNEYMKTLYYFLKY